MAQLVRPCSTAPQKQQSTDSLHAILSQIYFTGMVLSDGKLWPLRHKGRTGQRDKRTGSCTPLCTLTKHRRGSAWVQPHERKPPQRWSIHPPVQQDENFASSPDSINAQKLPSR